MWIAIRVDEDGEISKVHGPFNSVDQAKVFALGWAHHSSKFYEQETGIPGCSVEKGDTIMLYDPEGKQIWEFVWKEVK